MPYLTVCSLKELETLCCRLQDAKVIGYDTEFISEGRYKPELCLIQIAAGDLLVLIDPLTIEDLSPLWELFCDGDREIVVHASRSEMEFCYRTVGKLPKKLFDIQLAAGFLGGGFPASYSHLLTKFLRIQLEKSESRTDWRNRPLTDRQIDYALDDVRHLGAITDILQSQLALKSRLHWYYEESEKVKAQLQFDFKNIRWTNLPKIATLQRRELAVLEELCWWRDAKAAKKNCPVYRILRDDLLVELARRKTDDKQRIASIRGMTTYVSQIPELAQVIRRGLDRCEDELPQLLPRTSFPQYAAMTQMLYAALGSVCKQQQIAIQLVGGPYVVREFIASELGTLPDGIIPKLATGWRAELAGTFLHDVLHGRKSLRLDYRQPDEPIVFE